MFAATSRYEPQTTAASCAPAALQRGDGALDIAFVRRGDATVLAHLYQRTPCRALFPRAEPGDLPLAVLITMSGGIAGGDRLRLAAAAKSDAMALATTAAAEKVYRSLGPAARIEIALAVDERAWLEWVPQETILFDGARLARRIDAAMAGSGRLLAADMVVFGRVARGERFARGMLHDVWRVRVDGRLVWADALRLDGDVGAQIDRPSAFAGAVALATVVYVAADAAELLPLARALAEDDACRGGATVVNGVLLARFLGARDDTVRRALVRYVAGLRHAAACLPAAVPRLWYS
jgi:urease accessory protein